MNTQRWFDPALLERAKRLAAEELQPVEAVYDALLTGASDPEIRSAAVCFRLGVVPRFAYGDVPTTLADVVRTIRALADLGPPA